MIKLEATLAESWRMAYLCRRKEITINGMAPGEEKRAAQPAPTYERL